MQTYLITLIKKITWFFRSDKFSLKRKNSKARFVQSVVRFSSLQCTPYSYIKKKQDQYS